MKFDALFIEKVLEANNIIDIIGQYTSLKRSGNQLTGLCPFPDHNEKSPSFSVSEAKQVYHCFGCKKSGNIITFIQHFQGLSFPETIEYLAKRASIAMPAVSDYNEKAHQQFNEAKKSLYEANEEALKFYHQELIKLPKSHATWAYIKKRGISDEMVFLFKIGLAREGWENLTQHLKNKKMSLKPAEKSGLIKPRTTGQPGHYDLFRERLLFPILSHLGQCIGFGGRILGDGQPKYLNSPESEVFHKGKILYGLHETAKFIRTDDYVIVVEGYMDFIALFSAGIKNVVATLGTALTADHAKLLKRYTNNIILMFDGDSAGQQAIERSFPILLENGLYPKTCVLPDQLDPDECLQKKGKEYLLNLVTNSPESFFAYLETLLVGYKNTPADKVKILDQLKPILLNIQDLRLQDLYIKELAQRLVVDVPWVYKALKVADRDPKKQYRPVEAPKITQTPTPAVPLNKDSQKIKVQGAIPKAELLLINLALMDPKHLNELERENIVEQFSHNSIKEIFNTAVQLYRQMPSKFDTLTALLVDKVEPQWVLSQQLAPPLAGITDEEASKLVLDCIKSVKQTHIRTKTKELTTGLSNMSHEDQQKKLEQIMYIQRSKHTLRKGQDL